MSYDIPDGFGLVTLGFQNQAVTSDIETIRFGVELTDTSTFTDAQWLTLSNTIRDRMKTVVDAGWFVGGANILYNASGTMVTRDDPLVEAGTAVAADYSPPAVASIWTKRTLVAGVRNRGRFYVPGVPETLVSEVGVLDATYRANLQTVADGLLTDLTADPAVDSMVLLHSTGLLGPPRPVLSLEVQGIVGTVRKRQRR